MEHQTYQVQLPVYQGPLDLLLHLIEQQQLEITTISLAQVTDQYLDYLRSSENVAPDELADFLTVAARLLLIKSRALLPSPPQVVDEEEDVGEDLVRQLREYSRFKQAAQVLHHRDQERWHAYTRTTPPVSLAATWPPKLDLSGTSLGDLVAALQSLLRREPATNGEFMITNHTVTIDEKIVSIGQRLRPGTAVTFRSLLDDATSRLEIVVTLIAILEMIHAHMVSVRQERLFGEILVLPAEEGTRGTTGGPRPQDPTASAA